MKKLKLICTCNRCGKYFSEVHLASGNTYCRICDNVLLISLGGINSYHPTESIDTIIIINENTSISASDTIVTINNNASISASPDLINDLIKS